MQNEIFSFRNRLLSEYRITVDNWSLESIVGGNNITEYIESIYKDYGKSNLSIVLEMEKNIIGFLIVAIAKVLKPPFLKTIRKHIIFHDIVLAKNYQKMEYKNKLFDYLIQYAKDNNYHSILLPNMKHFKEETRNIFSEFGFNFELEEPGQEQNIVAFIELKKK